jgi:hypothetical protein
MSEEIKDLLQRLKDEGPWTNGRDDEYHCFYCCNPRSHYHESDCDWLVINRLTKKRNLAAPARVWDWNLAPDAIKAQAAMNGDDVDWLVWLPEHQEGDSFTDALETLGFTHFSFYCEKTAQKFLGADHRGDGFLITICHS